MVFLTNGIHDTSGQSLEPSATYASYKAAPADCSNFTAALQKGLCGFAKSQLAIAAATGLSTANVVLSWSFSTQYVNDTLGALAQIVPAQTIAVQATGVTTKALSPALAGKANVYVGTTSVPYYLTKSATPSSTARADELLVGRGSLAGAGPRPGQPQPHALQSGAGQDGRPHDPGVRHGAERHGCRRHVRQAGGRMAGGDRAARTSGQPIPGRGDCRFVRGRVLRGRCHRHAFARGHRHDEPVLPGGERAHVQRRSGEQHDGRSRRPTARSIPRDSTGSTCRARSPAATTGGRARPTSSCSRRRSRSSTSTTTPRLTSIRRGSATSACRSAASWAAASSRSHANVRTATLSVPGGVIARLALDSPAFAPSIIAGLGAQGLVANSTIFNNYFRDFQTMLDSGDPFSRILASQATVPIHMQKVVGDTVVPNSATDRLIAAGNLRRSARWARRRSARALAATSTMTGRLARVAVRPNLKPGRYRRDADPGGEVRRVGRAARRPVRGHHEHGGGAAVIDSV